MKSLFAVVSVLVGGVCVARAAEVDPFAEGVRPTEPVSAEEQAKTFRLPPGFQVQLVVALYFELQHTLEENKVLEMGSQ